VLCKITFTYKVEIEVILMDYKALGRRIREERMKLNLTQEKLAEKVDISDSYIGQIERGEKSLTLDTLVRLANCLGVTVDFLLEESINNGNDKYIDMFAQLLYKRTSEEKQMAFDVVKVMYSHLDKK
jgi:transcriptional regulator with XRE-family HTH domain